MAPLEGAETDGPLPHRNAPTWEESGGAVNWPVRVQKLQAIKKTSRKNIVKDAMMDAGLVLPPYGKTTFSTKDHILQYLKDAIAFAALQPQLTSSDLPPRQTLNAESPVRTGSKPYSSASGIDSALDLVSTAEVDNIPLSQRKTPPRNELKRSMLSPSDLRGA